MITQIIGAMMGTISLLFALLLATSHASSPYLEYIARQDGGAAASSKFYNYTEMLDTYNFEGGWALTPDMNLSALCPRRMTYTQVRPPNESGPKTERTVSYRRKCAPPPTPRTH